MSQSKQSGTHNQQSANQSEEDVAKKRAGKQEKSSHDHTSRQKAETGKGAGGGSKQKSGH